MDEARGKTLDAVAIAALVALWAETLVSIPGLPDVIPTSFGHDGLPQAYGSRFELLLLPAIATVMWAIIAITLRSGYVRLNVPFTIPEDRIALIQPVSVRMQRLLRAELLVGFVALQWAIIESAKADQLVAGFMAIVFVTVGGAIALVSWFIRRVWTIAKG